MLNVNKTDSSHLERVCLVAVDVRSTFNVGSLFRSCDGFGAELFLVGISPHPVRSNDSRLPHIAQKAEREIAKTALGAEKSVRWQYAESLESCIEVLKKDGFRVVAIEQSSSSRELMSLEGKGNIALVLGREVTGLSESELGLCSEVFEIPMRGQKESFNVSVAAGIALYQIECVSRSIGR
jgi:tRNA G18 (ribose-2'-O)-methylase SpoU